MWPDQVAQNVDHQEAGSFPPGRLGGCSQVCQSRVTLSPHLYKRYWNLRFGPFKNHMPSKADLHRRGNDTRQVVKEILEKRQLQIDERYEERGPEHQRSYRCVFRIPSYGEFSGSWAGKKSEARSEATAEVLKIFVLWQWCTVTSNVRRRNRIVSGLPFLQGKYIIQKRRWKKRPTEWTLIKWVETNSFRTIMFTFCPEVLLLLQQ